MVDMQEEISVGINWSGHEADHLTPSGDSFKKCGAMPFVFMVWCSQAQ
jgi:hypothetical protein